MKFKYILISILIHGLLFLVLSLDFKTQENSVYSEPNTTVQVSMSNFENTGKQNDSQQNTPDIKENLNSDKTKENLNKDIPTDENLNKVEKKLVKLEEVFKEKSMKTFSKVNIKKENNINEEPVLQELNKKISKETTADEKLNENSEIEKSDKSVDNLTEKSLSPVAENNAEKQDTDKKTEENFIQTNDGSLAAKNQWVDGLIIKYINTPNPKYPSLAKKLGVKGEFLVKVRFLVDIHGDVEEIKFYSDPLCKKYGFENEVKKVIQNWKTEPIRFHEKLVKVYFYKTFRFSLQNK